MKLILVVSTFDLFLRFLSASFIPANQKEYLDKIVRSLREPVKNYLADFVRQGGKGTPPFR